MVKLHQQFWNSEISRVPKIYPELFKILCIYFLQVIYHSTSKTSRIDFSNNRSCDFLFLALFQIIEFMLPSSTSENRSYEKRFVSTSSNPSFGFFFLNIIYLWISLPKINLQNLNEMFEHITYRFPHKFAKDIFRKKIRERSLKDFLIKIIKYMQEEKTMKKILMIFSVILEKKYFVFYFIQ